MWIDLNCDMGESFGAYTIGADELMMPLVTSANIACGFHAGDPVVLDKTVALAKKFGVAIGAHPGFPDVPGFGRRNMQLSADELENAILYQVSAIAGFCQAHGVPLVHCKPHGALYNMAANNATMAHAIARGIARSSPHIIFVGLASSSVMADAATAHGLKFAREAFADRVYNPDGSLQSRAIPGSLVTNPDQAAQQAVNLANGFVIAHDGTRVPIDAQTLCLHGDNPAAVQNAQAVRRALANAGIVVRAFQNVSDNKK
jgi:UPF0271 protein